MLPVSNPIIASSRALSRRTRSTTPGITVTRDPSANSVSSSRT
jgi:hypothetical protein